MEINKKNSAINAVKKVLVKHYLNKCKGETTEDDRTDAEEEATLLMKGLYSEIWDLNKKRVRDEMEEEYEQKLKCKEEELKNEADKKNRISNFEGIMTLIVEGIIVALIVGIIVNQITELLEALKLSISKAYNLSVLVLTLIITVIGVICIVFILIKKFFDKFGDLLHEIYKPK